MLSFYYSYIALKVKTERERNFRGWKYNGKYFLGIHMFDRYFVIYPEWKEKYLKNFYTFCPYFITGNEVNLDTTLNPPPQPNVLKIQIIY